MVEVRDTPWWLPARRRPTAVLGRIYVPRRLRARLEREDPQALEDLVDHATIQAARQHARGRLRWHAGYLLSRRFRWNEEKAAWWSALRRRRDRGAPLSDAEAEALAVELAGWRYRFMTDGRSARAFIDAAQAPSA